MGIFFSRVRRHRESAIHTASRVYSIGLKLYLYAVLGVQESSNCYVYVSIEHSKKYI